MTTLELPVRTSRAMVSLEEAPSTIQASPKPTHRQPRSSGLTQRVLDWLLAPPAPRYRANIFFPD